MPATTLKPLNEMTVEELRTAHLDAVLDARETAQFDGDDRHYWDYVSLIQDELRSRGEAY